MIVKMKKISLLLFYREKDHFLKSLQSLGVVQIETMPDITSAELESALELHSRCDRTIKLLKKLQGSSRPALSDEESGDPQAILEEFDRERENLFKIESSLKEMEITISRLSPWGDFDPEKVKKLAQGGVKTRFFALPHKIFKELNLDEHYYSIISRDREKVFFALFDKGESTDIKCVEEKLPGISLSKALEKFKDLKSEKLRIESSLERLTSHIDVLSGFKIELENVMQFREAELHMKEEGKGRLLSMTGWFTHDKEDNVRAFLDSYSSCYLIADPGYEDNVPISLKNSPFTRLFEPVTRIFSLPAYFELDPTPFFAPFFALFFGLCLADMGYGLILFIAMTILTFKGPVNLKPIFTLGMVLGLLTIAGGMFLNSFFGHAIFSAPGLEEGYFRAGNSLAPLGAYVKEGQMLFPAMTFALILGFAQVILGMILQALNRMKRLGFLYGLQPLSHIMMISGGLILAAHADVMGLGSLQTGPLPVGESLRSAPSFFGTFFLSGGLILLFLFNNPDKKMLFRPALGMWELYGFITALMGDILSYLRIFALGLAGGLLGNAVNRIAFMIITDDSGSIDYASLGMIATITVLIFGHSLNMAIAALGGFVHSLRLTFVEFYKNLKFEGGSRAFEPFTSKK